MSSSALRAWMTSGSPVSRAAAICVRKPCACAGPRRLVVVVVEPGLADRHDLRMRRQPDQLVGRDVELLGGVVRMRADRAIDLVMRLGDRQHAGEALHPRRDRHHAADACSDRARDHRIALLGEVREIEMAMAVDEQPFQSFRLPAGEGAVARCYHVRVAIDDVQSGSRRATSTKSGL